jgi:hypothetical protein
MGLGSNLRYSHQRISEAARPAQAQNHNEKIRKPNAPAGRRRGRVRLEQRHETRKRPVQTSSAEKFAALPAAALCALRHSFIPGPASPVFTISSHQTSSLRRRVETAPDKTAPPPIPRARRYLFGEGCPAAGGYVVGATQDPWIELDRSLETSVHRFGEIMLIES